MNKQLAMNLEGAIAAIPGPAPGKTDTSRAAAEKVTVRLTGLRFKVYSFIQDHKEFGATSDEIVRNTGIPIQSVSGRLTELRKGGLIYDSDKRRPNRRGNQEIVFVTTWRGDPPNAET